MEKFSFFNDVNDDRVYYAEDWARHLKKYFTNGIFNNELNVVSNNDMTITIKEGDANIEGYRYTNTGDLVKTIDNADGTLNRIDNVVLRLDLTNRLISAQIIKGTFADKPVAPELVRTSTIYDLRIAKISIPAGTTTITQDLITDTRFITSDCGNVISTVQTPDTENLFIQMQTLFEKQINELNNNFEIWFDSIKNQLDSDAAGNLQNQINNLNSNKVDNAKYDLDSNNLQLLANGKNVGDSVHIPTGITDTATGEEDLKIVNNKGVVKFSLEGKTEQKSYIGKNLLNYVDNLQSISGLTNTLNPDGSITTAGKPTADYTRIVKNYDITNLLEDKQVYTISQEKLNRKVFIQISAKKKDGTYTYYDSSAGKLSFTVDKSLYTNYSIVIQTPTMSVWGDESLTITNKYMLCKGTDTADSSFEPYVGATPSPNPDYPQEIENIRGVENLLKLPDGTYESNGITTVIKDGVITLNGTATANSFISIPFNYTFLANINYTLSANNTLAMGGENYIRFNYGTTVYFPCRFSPEKSKFTNNFNENTIVNAFTIRTESGKTYNNFVIKPMLEEGAISHDFVLPGTNYLQLEDRTENLIGLDNKQYRVNLKKGDKILAVNNGTTNLNLNLYTNYGDTARNDFFTIAANSQRSIVIANDSRAIAWGGTLNNIAWVVKGDKFIPYEPYKSQTINIDLKGNKLCSNKEQTLKDELIIENGRAKIYKKIKEVVLTGNESITRQTTLQSNKYRFNITCDGLPSINSDVIPDLLCSHFKPTNRTNTYNCINGIALGQNIVQVYDDTLSSMSEDEFKAKLKSLYAAGTPVIIQYPLSEPEIIDLGKVDFELLEGNSTLNLEEDLKSNMSIKYYIDSTVVDLKKKVENKQNVILHGTTIPSNDLGEDGDIYLQHN